MAPSRISVSILLLTLIVSLDAALIRTKTKLVLKRAERKLLEAGLNPNGNWIETRDSLVGFHGSDKAESLDHEGLDPVGFLVQLAKPRKELCEPKSIRKFRKYHQIVTESRTISNALKDYMNHADVTLNDFCLKHLAEVFEKDIPQESRYITEVSLPEIEEFDEKSVTYRLLVSRFEKWNGNFGATQRDFKALSENHKLYGRYFRALIGERSEAKLGSRLDKGTRNKYYAYLLWDKLVRNYNNDVRRFLTEKGDEDQDLIRWISKHSAYDRGYWTLETDRSFEKLVAREMRRPKYLMPVDENSTNGTIERNPEKRLFARVVEACRAKDDETMALLQLAAMDVDKELGDHVEIRPVKRAKVCHRFSPRLS